MTDDENEETVELVAVSMAEITMGIIDTVIKACGSFSPEMLAQYVEIAEIKLNEPDDPEGDNLAKDVIMLGQVAANALLELNSTMEAQVRSTEIFNKAMARYIRHKQAENN